MVRQSVVEESVVSQGSSNEVDGRLPVTADPFELGRQTVPQAIDDLGLKGVSLGEVAILRFIWRFGKSNWTRVFQPTLAKHLGVSVRTAQRWLAEARKHGLIEFQESERKPQDRGYLCEDRIAWSGVFRRHGYRFSDRPTPTLEKLLEFNGSKVTELPGRFFSEAKWLKHGNLRVVTRDGISHDLPRGGIDALRYVAETHFGRPIANDSIETFAFVAGQVTPRLLALFSFALAYTKTKPDSPGYYTRLLQKNRKLAFVPPQERSTAKHEKETIRTIRIEPAD
jgi:hypothetical protein